MRVRIAAATAALLAAGALIVGLLPAAAAVPKAPPTFVAVTSGGTMSLYSSSTGARVRTLATLSARTFTNNGLAYAPDGGSVYFTLLPRRHSRKPSLRLMRLDVATGRQTFVADGAQPAISDDSKQLAYGAQPNVLAIRNLATGQTRTIALSQLGKADMLNAAIHWLGDGADVAIVPSGTAWDLVGKPPRLSWCGTSQRHPVVVFVHVPAAPAPLTARCVRLAGAMMPGAVALGSTRAAPKRLLMAGLAAGGAIVVDSVDETGAATRLAKIPDSLALAFDPSGTHLLYLAGHTPPRLTEATIANGQLTQARWHRRIDLGASAW